MTHVAYIRVSTVEQNTERQLKDTGVNFSKVFEDKCSGGSVKRPQLEAMKEYVREGDTIHIHSIDRLARDLGDLKALVSGWNNEGVNVQFHKEGLHFKAGENGSKTADLMLNILGAVAEFERSMIRERQAEGIAKAKAKGIYKGRKPSIDKASILAELDTGLSMRKVAEKLGVSLSTVQRAKQVTM
ncbi:recombinase family protein [Aestuariicella sp. G3-2]|uniref:recombinase family protein n=1 Tax=Pseudomaricurvus albidus TaxID=2842452 RepID=UPI001C0E811A|nr:recombinase family protein [Aestuariicella albida]MBU3068538.1 recombinase family protein [Aestuariicella albida]